jgi:uncharacterized protein
MVGIRRIFQSCAVFLLVALLSATLAALEVPPLNNTPVNDLANILSASEKTEITQFLRELDRDSKAQIAVLTVPSLEGDDIDSFAMRVADKWQIGEKGLDSGVLVVVAFAEHEITIKTGYGVEGNLTDAKCGLIIRNVIVPAFQKGQYGQGIYAAVKSLAGIVLNDESLIAEDAVEESHEDSTDGIIAAVFMLFIFFTFISMAGRRRGFMLLPLFFPSIGRGGGSGFSSGGSGFSGFSGGGGHFGGGGARGKW